MAKILVTAGCVLLGLFGLSNPAWALTKQCERCTEQQMDSLAGSSLSQYRYGPLYVADLRGGVVRKYYRMSNEGPNFDPEYDVLEVWAQEVTPEVGVSGYMQQAGILARQLVEQVVVNPNRPDLPSDAQQALSRTDMDDDMDAYIKSMTDAAALNGVVGWLNSYSAGLFDPKTLLVTMEVIYQDGSRALYQYDPKIEKYVRVPDSSRDASGNKIPETKQQAVGITFYFPNSNAGDERAYDDFVDMYSRLTNMGVPIINMSPGSGATHAIVCVEGSCMVQVIQ